MGKAFFITGCGTGIGKTVVTCSLIRQFKEYDMDIGAIKPLISGWEHNVANNDTLHILSSLALSHSQENIEKTSPWRFTAPLAISMAARKEKKEIDYDAVADFCRTAINKYEYLLIEGAGGIMSPLSDNKTGLDLISELSIPTLLVTGSYLGSISHTLTAIKSMESAGIKIQAIVVNESEGGVPLQEIISELKNFTGHSVFHMRRMKAIEGFIWQETDDLLKCILKSDFFSIGK